MKTILLANSRKIKSFTASHQDKIETRTRLLGEYDEKRIEGPQIFGKSKSVRHVAAQ